MASKLKARHAAFGAGMSNRMTTVRPCTASLFLLAAALSTPNLCLANPAAMAAGLMQVYLYFFGWLALTLIVFLVARRLVRKWSLLIAALFLCSPVLYWMGNGLRETWVRYISIGSLSQEINPTTKPLSVAGVVFPPGSRAFYGRDKDGVWYLADIESPTPLFLGKLEITRIDRGFRPPSYSHANSLELMLTLTRPQKIDGWECSPHSVLVSYLESEPKLMDCRIQPATVGEISWPAGTEVESYESGWRVTWRYPDGTYPYGQCHGGIRAFGFSFEKLSVDYDGRRNVSHWSGRTCESYRIGQYLFDGEAEAMPDKSIRLRGRGQDSAGNSVHCLLMPPTGKNPKICDD